MIPPPVIPHQDAGLARLLGDLVPEERRTLAEIVDRSDLLMVDGKPWLLVEATPGLVERLATFQAATEDLEPDLEDEGETDDDRDNDNPADQNGLREDLEDDDRGGVEHDGREPEEVDIAGAAMPRGWWGDADPRKL